MDFLEQLLQALFIIFLNFYLYLFVAAGCVSCGEVVQRFRVHPSLENWDLDWLEGFYLFFSHYSGFISSGSAYFLGFFVLGGFLPR